MRVRIDQQMSGGRPDGQPWPAVGEMLDCTDAEGAELIASGVAVPSGTRHDADPLAGQDIPDRSERVIEPDGTEDPAAAAPAEVKPAPAAAGPAAAQAAGTVQPKGSPSPATSPPRVAKPASGSK